MENLIHNDIQNSYISGQKALLYTYNQLTELLYQSFGSATAQTMFSLACRYRHLSPESHRLIKPDRTLSD